MRTDIAEILEVAADLYESEQIEWCQTTFFNGRPGEEDTGDLFSACAWGAIVLAATESSEEAFAITGPPAEWYSPERELAWNAVEAAKRAVEVKLSRGLPYFNDYYARSKQEIINLFKETAKDLRNQS